MVGVGAMSERCYCGADLDIRVVGPDGLTRCDCAYCRDAVDQDGASQYVIGYGRSAEQAVEDWRAAMQRL